MFKGIAQLLELALLSSWTTYIWPSKPPWNNKVEPKYKENVKLSVAFWWVCGLRTLIERLTNAYRPKSLAFRTVWKYTRPKETLPALKKNPLVEDTAIKSGLFSADKRNLLLERKDKAFDGSSFQFNCVSLLHIRHIYSWSSEFELLLGNYNAAENIWRMSFI